jgi:hypothetical protein
MIAVLTYRSSLLPQAHMQTPFQNAVIPHHPMFAQTETPIRQSLIDEPLPPLVTFGQVMQGLVDGQDDIVGIVDDELLPRDEIKGDLLLPVRMLQILERQGRGKRLREIIVRRKSPVGSFQGDPESELGDQALAD